MPATVEPVESYTAYCPDCDWESEVLHSFNATLTEAKSHNNEHHQESK